MKPGTKTKKFMKSVREFLTKKYGDIKPEWELSLDLLESTLEQYNRCCEVLDRDGVIIDGQRGVTSHPANDIKNKCQIRIEKIFTELGLTPKAAAKLSSNEDDTEDLIEDLVN